MNESCVDFQQDGCLYKSTCGIQWSPKHSWMSDRPQKQASEKQTSQLVAVVLWQLVSLLIELLIGDEKVPCHCVRKWWVLANPVTYGPRNVLFNLHVSSTFNITKSSISILHSLTSLSFGPFVISEPSKSFVTQSVLSTSSLEKFSAILRFNCQWLQSI